MVRENSKYERAFDYIADKEPENIKQAKQLFGDNWSSGAQVATFDYFTRQTEYENAIKVAIIKEAERTGRIVRPQDVQISVERREVIDRYGERHRVRIYRYRVTGEFQERYTGYLGTRKVK